MDLQVLPDVGWILVAFLAGIGARMLRLPPLVGYLGAGMGLAVVGVEAGPVVDRVGELGVALLLFVVGSTLRQKTLTQREVLGAGSVHFVLATLLGAAGGWAFGLSLGTAFVVGASLGVSSLVLAAKALDAQNDLNAYHGRIAVAIALLHAIAATAVIATLGDVPSPYALGLVLLPLLRPALLRALQHVESSEMVVLAGLALAAAGMLGFQAVGVSGELGALAAGALVANTDVAQSLREALSPIKDVFLAAFFLSVGLIGLPAVGDLVIVAGLIGLLFVKTGLLYGTLVSFRLEPRPAFLATLPLATFSGFTLIVGNAAVDAGRLDASVLPVLALATVVSYLLNAPVAPRAALLWDRTRAWIVGDADASTPIRTLGGARFLVVGMGRAGTAAYDYLAGMMQCTVGMDEDPSRLSHHREEGRRVLYGDARDDALWREIDAEALEAVILAFPRQEAKLRVIHLLRENGFDGAISALTSDPDDRDALLDAGANAVYLSIEQAGQALAAYGMKRRSDPVPGTVTLDVQSSVPASRS